MTNGSKPAPAESRLSWDTEIPTNLDSDARRTLVKLCEVVEKYQDDSEVIFSNKSEALQRRFAASSRDVRAWRMSRKCIFSGCTRASVSRSHTLPKAASLDVIAEDGQVATPVVNLKTGNVEVATTGVRLASVFPGFCPEHEALFAAFEKSGSVTGARDFVLQMYRSICREIVMNQFALEGFERSRREYLLFRDKKLRELTLAELGPKAAQTVSLGVKMKSSDWRYRWHCGQIRRQKAVLRCLKRDFYDPATKDVREGWNRRMSIAALRLDVTIPVALSGLSSFEWSDASGRNAVLAILCVMPMPDKTTYIAITGPKRHGPAIEAYFQYYAQNPVLVLDMIESWMMYGTDHWFLRPSVWTTIQDAARQNLMREFAAGSSNVTCECPFTVFNELKRNLLTKHDMATSMHDESAVERQLLRKELTKLSDQDSSRGTGMREKA